MCGETGIGITSETVESIAETLVEDKKMLVCLNPICEIVYFGTDFYPLMFLRFIKTPIHFKEESDIKYICYCHHLTYENVKEMVLIGGRRKVKDVLPIGCDIISSKCNIKHPLGCTCAGIINQYIDSLLKDHQLL